MLSRVTSGRTVVTENSVPSENTEVPIIREIMAVTTMSSLFVAVFALVVSTFRTRAALQTENQRFVTNLRFFKTTRRVACASTVATGCCGLCCPILVRLAAMSSHGPARHGPALAPQSFCLALDEEIATPSWKAGNSGKPS